MPQINNLAGTNQGTIPIRGARGIFDPGTVSFPSQSQNQQQQSGIISVPSGATMGFGNGLALPLGSMGQLLPASPTLPKSPSVPPVSPPSVSPASPPGATEGQTRGLFPTVAGSLAGLSSGALPAFGQFQNTAQGAATALMGSVPQQSEAVQQATKNLQDLQNQYAIERSRIGNSPIGLSEAGGELGLLNTQYSGQLAAAQTALQNALQGNAQLQAAYTGAGGLANTAAGMATGQQQAQQAGLAAAGGLVQPQAYGPTNVPFSPAEAAFGRPALQAFGGGGFTGLGILQGQQAAGQQYVQNQAILGKVRPMALNLDTLIQDENINPTDVTFLNQLDQWARGTLSDSAIPKFQGQLNDIVSSLSSILGIPSSATSDFRTQMAGAIVNGIQSGQSVSDAVNYFVQQAQQASQGYLRGAQGANVQGNAYGTTNTANPYSWDFKSE